MSDAISSCSSRRRFLRVVAEGGALAGAAALGVGCGTGGASGTITAGNVSALPVGTLTTVPSEPVAIGRDAAGVWAMTLICTHQSCDMSSAGSVSSSGVTCACHGSRFSTDGAVLQGPAQSPLEHYEVTISAAGVITIDADVTVDASTRAAVA